MDNIILGILLLSSRTIYQLRERIDKGLNMMYSSSMGSIQAAIKKLLNYGYIQYEETVENGKYKKIYSITESGKQKFIEWVSSPMEKMCIRDSVRSQLRRYEQILMLKEHAVCLLYTSMRPADSCCMLHSASVITSTFRCLSHRKEQPHNRVRL